MLLYNVLMIIIFEDCGLRCSVFSELFNVWYWNELVIVIMWEKLYFVWKWEYYLVIIICYEFCLIVFGLEEM